MAKEKPAWIETLPASTEFVYAIGIKSSAPTLESGRAEALRHALAEIVNHLGVRVQSKLEVFQTELETQVRDELKTASEKVTVRGGLIQEWFVETTPQGAFNVYVLLRIPRAEIEKEKARLARVMAEKALLAQQGIRQAKEAELAGDVPAAMAGYVAVLVTAADAEDEASRSEALRRVGGMLQRIQLRLVSGSGQAAEIARGAKDPLVLKATLQSDREEVAITRLPIRFRWLSGEEQSVCESRTDEQGIASCRVPRLQTMAREAAIQAAIDADRLVSLPVDLAATDRQKIASMVDVLKTRGVEFTLHATIEKKDLRIVVLIREDNLGKPMEESLVGNAIAAKLTEAGYQVVADHEIGKANADRLSAAIQKEQFWSLGREVYGMAQFAIVGTCLTRPGSGTTGPDLRTSRADGMVKVIELAKGAVVAHKNLVNVPGFGQTQEQAGLNALQRLSGPMAEAILEQLLFREQ